MNRLGRDHRRGLTLMEISLVLFLLVLIAALTVPNFQGVLDRERLRRAAESIGADWTMTRAVAMEDGETQVWACEIGASSYSGNAMSSAAGGLSGSDELGSTSLADVSSAELTESLPEGYVITEVKTSELNSLVSMAVTAQSSASGRAMVLFYPDGTCSNARLTVAHEDTPEDSLTVVMNGLAGTVRVLTESASSGANQ